jgi:hypothetical protein
VTAIKGEAWLHFNSMTPLTEKFLHAENEDLEVMD